MRCIIIEDSYLASEELAHLLEPYDDISIVGTANNGEEALKMIKDEKPDLIFLDIHLPGINGFELLEKVDEIPDVIFTTAYDQYALKAFDVDAIDYLKKPIHEDRLDLAIQKVKNRAGALAGNESDKGMINTNSRVFVKDGDRCWFVDVSEIKLLEIVGNYTRIYFRNHKPMILKSLNYMESRLDQSVFFRINRQQIVNIHFIGRVDPWYSGALKIWLQDDTELSVSRRQSIRLKDALAF
ncbi:MAG: response regulator transcription factor [Ekhidna sp.]|nr:response regulator transcription factor [Ekhidna sp.]